METRERENAGGQHRLRAIGWIVASLGALLVMLSAMIAAAVALMRSYSRDGSSSDAMFTYGLLAFVFVAGIAALIKGTRMVKHRRI
ncbi:MAG TPA: hypothetical protein VM164_13140 [Burkholderiales bacterium]|nr:hypothetical protein [Burkholderiales bacterium]